MFEARTAPRRAASWSCLAAAALGLASAPGCSDDGGVSDLKLFPVKGAVKLADGKPLASGVVVLAAPEMGMEFSAPVGADGSFVLRSPYGDGAPEGTYKVRIERDATRPDSQIRAGRKAAPAPYPARYGDEKTSGLTVVVKPADNALEPIVLSK